MSIDIFKNISEKDITPIGYDSETVRHLSSNLLHHNEQSDSIVKFFNDLEIDNYVYMSQIIIRSYHRHLNNIELDLIGQVNERIEIERPIKECEKIIQEKALSIYNQFNVLDSVQIKMPVSEYGSVFSYYCPNDDWVYRNNHHLTIDGIITDKFIIDNKQLYDHLVYNFKVIIMTMSNEETEFFMEKIKIGDVIEIGLEDSFKIE